MARSDMFVLLPTNLMKNINRNSAAQATCGPSNQIGFLATKNWLLKMVLPLVALVVAAIALTSCGGSAVIAASPFQGTFAGTWTSTGDSGTSTLTVAPNGTLTGTELDTTINRSGAVTGTLNSDGTFVGTVTPQGASAVTATGTFQITNNSNTLSGTVIYNSVSYTYTLNRQ